MGEKDLKRVLYVEDEPDIRTIAQLSLESEGLSVELCDSGLKAVAQAKAFRPDLILLDVMMPGMDGPSTLKALRADPATAPIPVAFMTAKTQANEIAFYKGLGAIGVILKPFDPLTLPTTVRDLWRAGNG